MVQAWDPVVPDLLMRIAQKIVEEPVEDPYGETGVDVLYEVLGKPVPNDDALYYARGELERLSRDPERAYEAVERLIAGFGTYDDQVTEALADEGITIEMVDGRFWTRDEVADELDVTDAGVAVTTMLAGRWAPAAAQWRNSQKALAQHRWPAAIADAANALEGVVKISSGRKNINEGTKALFTGKRSSLGIAINQLHNYASAMPGARHGAAVPSSLSETEARGVHQACGVFMAMIINLFEKG
jgi:hypothetical protein